MPDAPDEAASLDFSDARSYYGLGGIALGVASFALGTISFAAGSWLAATLAVLFGAQSLLYLRLAVFPEVRFRLTEWGVEVGARSGSPMVIEWSEVLDVHRSRFGQIEIKVRDEAEVWRKMSRWSRWRREHFSFRPRPVTIEGWRLSPDTESIFRALEDGMDQYALRTMKAEVALPAHLPDDPQVPVK